MSSTKLEIRNIFHCSQRRNEPRPWITRTENFMKFERTCSFEICKQTETYMLLAVLRTSTGIEVMIVDLNFGMLVYPIEVKFEGQNHRSKDE